MPIDSWEVYFRLFYAAVLGGIIGLERQTGERPAGFRTHILVSLGSCLMMVISFQALQAIAPFPKNWVADPMRIASNVITGIGFLGAGAIIRMGASVRGLTTAATLWTTCAIGLASGSGLYGESLFTVVLLLVALIFLQRAERIWKMKHNVHFLRITLREAKGTATLVQLLQKDVRRLRKLEIVDRGGGTELAVSAVVSKEMLPALLEELNEHPSVEKVEAI